MSVGRLFRTNKARKATRCEKCGGPVEVGTPFVYFFVGFRSRYKHVRHDTPACAPRMSERESSKKAGAYAAIETAQDAIAALRGTEDVTIDDVTSIIEQAASDINDVVQEYREADQVFGGGNGGSVSAELADELEAAANELEGWSPDAVEWDEDVADGLTCDEHGDDVVGDEDDQISSDNIDQARADCAECTSLRQTGYDEWLEGLLDEAEAVLDSVSF